MNVSVVIPAFNAESTLADTLASMTAQLSPLWEAIVVDDGSRDGTAAVAQAFAARDPRISVVARANGGESAARNTGVSHARYDWLLFLDADDWIAPRHIERLTAELASDPELGAVHCGSVRVARDGTAVADGYEAPAGDLFPTLARRAAFPVHACIVRKSLVEEVGGFDTSLRKSADWDLWQRIARTGARFGAAREVLAYYRMQPGSSSMDAAQLLCDGLRVLRRGHAPDPRVPRPDPVHANGAPQSDVAGQQFYLLSWCAGLSIGRGERAAPLLDALDGTPFRELYPPAIAQCLFDAVPLPTCRTAAAWSDLWPRACDNVREFLAALEQRSQARDLAAGALASLKQKIVAAASPVAGELFDEAARTATDHDRRIGELERDAAGLADVCRRERESTAIVAARQDALERQAVALRERTDVLQHRIEALEAAQAALEAERAALRSENASLASAKATLTSENAALAGKNVALTSENAALAGEKVALASEQAGLTRDNAALTNENAALTTENIALAGKSAILVSEKAALAAELASLASAHERLGADAARWQRAADAHQQRWADLERQTWTRLGRRLRTMKR